MELVTDSIVPAGAFTTGTQKRMRIITANHRGAAITTDLGFNWSAAAQAKANAGDILLMVEAFGFVGVYVPKSIVVGIPA